MNFKDLLRPTKRKLLLFVALFVLIPWPVYSHVACDSDNCPPPGLAIVPLGTFYMIGDIQNQIPNLVFALVLSYLISAAICYKKKW